MSACLGKPIKVRYRENPQENFGFAWLGGGIGSWSPSYEGVADLQQFLVIHRGHELRVLPGSAGGANVAIEFLFPDDDDTTDPHFNRTAFFEHEDAVLDVELDRQRVPESVLKKLKDHTQTD